MKKEIETIIENLKEIRNDLTLEKKAYKLWLRELVVSAQKNGATDYGDFSALFRKCEITEPAELVLCAKFLRREDLGNIHDDFSLENIDRLPYVVSNFCNSLSERTYDFFFGESDYKIIPRNSFGEIFDDIANEKSNYCIAPIENNTTGTLGNFYQQIFDYGLKIVKVCDVLNADTDTETRFALLASAPICLASIDEGEDLFEILIHSSDGSVLPRILEAARICKMIPDRIDSVPLSSLKKEHPFKIVFKMLPDVSLTDFLIYLTLDGISYTPVGIFSTNE